MEIAVGQTHSFDWDKIEKEFGEIGVAEYTLFIYYKLLELYLHFYSEVKH